ncbi:MAG: bifunctional [glutamate--ammonia ligase]-adenylyl-L-tyrosine phosphorylase/[glutamate--ammonia-ligase] adenylyltransferase, partial [Magnetococcales bacterium]|nr:bifunctional [glutamate--ammonia ligase]-adenylyl-L-tyrosine phosphorylase/[glutamate--ammonia-ligase] adenylyltransferase [Magnetococcales bacterium]
MPPSPPPLTPILAQNLDAGTQEAIQALAAITAEPEAARHRLNDLAHNLNSQRPELLPTLCQRLKDPIWQRRLLLAFGNSPFLTHILNKWPEFLEDEYSHDDPAAWNRNLPSALLATESRQEAGTLLRRHKHRTFLGIGLRDLTGEATLNETTQGLSALADASLEAGYRWLHRSLSATHGPPMTITEEEGRHPARFVILGMGKLGAGELNFSSDVDLIYLYDDDRGGCEGKRPLAIKEYFNKLGRELIRLLSEQTADGMVFRIDLRLRPEGESGDLTLSRRSAEIYYESWGRTWERSAMIKARAVAGDLELGAQFLHNLIPFVYRRYLDFAALDAIRDMKRRIDQKISARQDYHRNVKLGYGGIREIEFFVQCQQLIHGGKNPQLRHRATETVLEKLVDANLLAARTAQILIAHYRFLRTVEHRLQIERERQIHSIPEDAEGLLGLARRMGYADTESFRQRLHHVVEEVHGIYGQLFFEGERAHGEASDPMVQALLGGYDHEEQMLEALRQAGFVNPQQALGLIAILREGPGSSRLTERAREWYGRIAMPLLVEVLAAPDQDLALHHAEAFLRGLGHRINYLALLKENPSVLKLLIRLFGTSGLLSRFMIHHPELIDGLVTTDFLNRFRNRAELTRDLDLAMDRARDPEEAMQIMREFKNVETLRLGIRDLSGLAEPEEVTAGLSLLAEVCLQRVMQDARRELEARHGPPCYTDPRGVRHPAPFAILAMGKLGGRELGFSSDLDLIFMHGSHGEEQYTDHPHHSISNVLFFSRLGQRIITTITTLTRAGKLYELDMRLRPSGKSGPVVTSLESFIHYQTHDAWLWEHQALTRARPMTGDPEFMHDLHQAITTIFARGHDPATVQKEVANMRQRILEEKSPPPGWIDIKQSRGAIVDVEFLVQYLLLAHAKNHPEIVRANLPLALRALAKAGILARTEAHTLEEAYGVYRLVENRLRLLHDRSENRIGPDERIRNRLERLCHLFGEPIIPALELRFQQVIPIYQKHLGA